MTSANERILNLAAYLKERGSPGATLDDITRDVAGYDHDAARDADGELVSEGKEWEALRKKVRRDLEDLRAAWGIDTDYDEEEHRYRLRSAFFTARERAALIAAAATVAVEGLHPGVGEVGAGVDDLGTQMVLGVHPLVASLRAAIDERAPVHVEYEGRTRLLHPYALGLWRGRWYVAGWDPELDAMRRYRLDRIEDDGALTRTGETGAYEIPEWFDRELAFDFDPNAWGRDPRLRARVRVERDHLPRFLDELGGEVVDILDGEPAVAFDVRHYESTRNRLLFFGTHAAVVPPPELVAIVHDHLAALAGASGGSR
jgi:predicted DNA-binding transcriptional regulator YafY